MTRQCPEWRNRWRTCLGVLAAVPAILAAQEAPVRHGPVLTRTDAAIVGVAAVTSVVLIGLDHAIAEGVRGSSLQGNASVRGAMDVAGTYGDPGVLVIGAALWTSGHWGHDDTRRLIGLRSLEAVVASGIVTGALKDITGRARPDQSPDQPRDFVLGRGIGDRSEFQSFPSGHATAAFAFASAVDAEWSRLQPSHSRLVPALLYGAAALTGASRVYRNRHWTSDVVLGGAIGFVAGRAVVRWHADPAAGRP